MTVTCVPIELIELPDPIMRQFSETSVRFLELVDQIKDHNGCFQAPPARKRPDGRTQLIDGLRRYRGHIHAGVTHMSLNVMELDDTQYLAAQLACNDLFEKVDRIDAARHLNRLRNMGDSEMSHAELATSCKRSKSWVSNTLRLNHLISIAKDMVSRGEIPVGNAEQLSKLPQVEQFNYVSDAKTMSTREFSKVATNALNAYREAIKQGNLKSLGVDKLEPRMRHMDIIEAEIKTPTELPLLITSLGLTNPIDIIVVSLQWAFRIDPKTIDERKENMVQSERKRLNDMDRRKKDRNNLQNS